MAKGTGVALLPPTWWAGLGLASPVFAMVGWYAAAAIVPEQPLAPVPVASIATVPPPEPIVPLPNLSTPAVVPPLARPVADRPEAGPGRVAAVAAIIRREAVAVGVNPTHLLTMMLAESSARARARNPKSSAAGLLQFTETTWLESVRRFGAQVPGLEAPARRLTQPAPRHGTAALRRDVLALRYSTRLTARVAAELIVEDAGRFTALTGRPPRDLHETYTIWLVGVGTAAVLAQAPADKPVGEILSNKVVRANEELFAGGPARSVTVQVVRDRIDERLRRSDPVAWGIADATPTTAVGQGGTVARHV